LSSYFLSDVLEVLFKILAMMLLDTFTASSHSSSSCLFFDHQKCLAWSEDIGEKIQLATVL
jgi:hypothetical protein